MTPAQEFRQFLLNGTRGKEVISPTLLRLKLDILVQQELNFAKLAHKAGIRGDNFEQWYNGDTKEKDAKKELKTANYPMPESDELYP
jgi:hypothetical protein